MKQNQQCFFRSHFLKISTNSYLATTQHGHTPYTPWMTQTPNGATFPLCTTTPLVQSTPLHHRSLDSCIHLLFAFVVSMSASTPVVPYREPDDPSPKGHLITSFPCETPSEVLSSSLKETTLPSHRLWASKGLALLIPLFLSPPYLLTVPDLHTSLLQSPSLYPRCVAVGFFLSFRP